MTDNVRPELPKQLFWLKDAPLFIDDDQVARFYDAVARPQKKEGTTTLEITEEDARELKGKLNLEAQVMILTRSGEQPFDVIGHDQQS